MQDLQPKDLTEAIKLIRNRIPQEELEKISEMTEVEFSAQVHFGFAMGIRNEWDLWWFKGNKFPDWPKSEPAIVKHFREMGITHADDMSGIIFTSVYRDITGQPLELEKQILKYQKHWMEHGFPSGIPTHK